MQLSYALICKRPTLLNSLTGLRLDEFAIALTKFEVQYELLVVEPRLNRKDRVRARGAGRRGHIPEAADKLLFILAYVRMYPLLIILGLLFGMSEGRACEWVGKLLPVLEAALGEAQAMPKRTRGRSLEEIIEEYPELVDLGVIVDGVERPIRRPKDKTEQKDRYSGKKKRHTTKRVTLVHPQTQRILAVSDERDGSVHDKRALDEEEITCESSIPVSADSGFQGLSLGKARVSTPTKRRRKPKGQPKDVLTEQERARNAELARFRAVVEHANAGFKRSRAASDTLRCTRSRAGPLLSEIAMGLHNLRTERRDSYKMK